MAHSLGNSGRTRLSNGYQRISSQSGSWQLERLQFGLLTLELFLEDWQTHRLIGSSNALCLPDPRL
jgi:hypothetical protein